MIWRVAPPDDRSLIPAVLRAVERQRTADGLYGTWLADPVAYRCFHDKYRGDQINPPDVGVMMHVYLLLAQHDRERADRLCAALQQRIGDERIWVWYTIAPVMPIVREADLEQSGVSDPGARRAARLRPVGQEAYLKLGQELRDVLLDRERLGVGQSIDILRRAWRRTTSPPSGRIRWSSTTTIRPGRPRRPGIYWSPDLAYALWLRTYVEVARRSPGSLTPSDSSARNILKSISETGAARVAVSPLAYLSCIRFSEVLVLQGSPLFGVAFALHDLTLDKAAAIAVFGLASILLVANIWTFNDWANGSADLKDPNRSERVFSTKGVSARGLLVLLPRPAGGEPDRVRPACRTAR